MSAETRFLFETDFSDAEALDRAEPTYNEADLEAARACVPGIPTIDREIAVVLFGAGRAREADVRLVEHLGRHPRDASAGVLRGRVLLELGRVEEADALYKAAVARIAVVGHRQVIERALLGATTSKTNCYHFRLFPKN